LGAAHVVNYRTDSVSERIRALLGPQSIDVVAEQVGGPLFGESLRLLRSGGTLVTCGATADHLVEVDLRYLYARNLTLAGSSLGPRAEFRHLVELLNEGRISPLVDSILPIRDARMA